MSASALWFVVTLTAFFSGIGCGGGAAESDCDKLVDAYARAWQRCGRATYDDAKKTWSDALMCSKASSSNSGQVDMCANALATFDCTAITNGNSPSQCSAGTISQ
jgi:hypothetical protein